MAQGSGDISSNIPREVSDVLITGFLFLCRESLQLLVNFAFRGI